MMVPFLFKGLWAFPFLMSPINNQKGSSTKIVKNEFFGQIDLLPIYLSGMTCLKLYLSVFGKKNFQTQRAHQPMIIILHAKRTQQQYYTAKRAQ